jgi:tRNA (guanine-N7-)-methyltransferase
LVAELVPYTFREYLDKLRRDLIARHRDLVVVEEDGEAPEGLLARYDDPAAPLELEIGPGKDDFVVHAAAAAPGTNFLAVERLRERVEKLCRKIRRAGVTNVRVFFGDARFVVARLLRPGQLRAVYIHHPDPYPKRRHARRRLLQPDFVALLADRMAPGALLNVSTDVRPYAEQILECLERTPGLVSRVAPEPWVTELPGYPQSVYERKRRAAGATIHYILFHRRGGEE